MAPAPRSRARAAMFDPNRFDQLRWRHIGPFRGGRVAAVAGDPSERDVFYFGSAGGGVFKTTDGGLYWRNISDGFFNSGSIGAIAVAAADPNVLFVGTGESCVRNSVSPGDGVYRSLDAGRNWVHCGLTTTRHISRVRIHPTNPDIVYVAALGDIFSESPDRGVYRSTDAGATWELVLHRSPRAGAADLWLDPTNPRILYAALWDAQRMPWTIRSGGPDSALYRSIDGGDTWEDITGHSGLPTTTKGRIGVTSSPARGSRVWALVEAADDKGGLYRSDDYGDTWDLVSTSAELLGRPFYYSHIVADPQDADTIYSMNFKFLRSSDGGANFTVLPTPHGDNHDLWIDPNDNCRMIEGNDGGACVSFNAGETFSSLYNQPTSQHYRIAIDSRTPYRVYGTQQDNSAIAVPSRSRNGVITWADCYMCGFSESGHIVVDPRDPNIVYSGAVGSSPGGGGPLMRYDHSSGTTQLVTVWPEYNFGEAPADLQHRFNWTFPIALSPHDPAVLYACGERVFRSTNGGRSWESISPDLTRADPAKLERSGGPITPDTSGAETYCTILTFAESPHRAGVFWVGTDDGLVQLSRNGGKTWKPVTPSQLKDWTMVQTVEPSPHRANTAYLAATRYRLGDRRPFIFRTDDLGASWHQITKGIPDDDFVRVVRADPARPGLLYAGTESRVYVSFDDGDSWQVLSGNLPRVPVYDIQVAGDDLVIATHGRGFWILDDVTPLRELAAEARQPVLFTPPVTHRFWSLASSWGATEVREKGYFLTAFIDVRRKRDGTIEEVMLDAGANPPDGVPISYWLPKDAAPDDVELTILDARGREVARFSPQQEPRIPSEDSATTGATEPPSGEGEELEGEPVKKWRWQNLPRHQGFNRFWWNLRHSGVLGLPDDKGRRVRDAGPTVAPGRYEAQLRVGAKTLSTSFDVVPDPSVRVSQRDLRAQTDLLLQLRDKHDEVNGAILWLRACCDQLAAYVKRPALGPIEGDVKTTQKAAAALLERLTQTKYAGTSAALMMPVGLDAKLRDLALAAGMGDTRPPDQFRDAADWLCAQADDALAELDRFRTQDLPALNQAIAGAAVAPIDPTVPEPKPY